MVAAPMGGPVMGMRPGDLVVEYRDRNLVRRGSIPLDDLDLKVQPVLNGVGSWSLALPAEHKAAAFLRTPGAGVIITNVRTNRVVMSGSASKPTRSASSGDPKGTTTISGLSDDRLLWDAVSFPQPSNSNSSTQNVSHDIFAGDAESAMRHFVDANIGLSAPTERKGLSLRSFVRLEAVNKHLGGIIRKTIRFDYVGDVLLDIAKLANLRFSVVQVGGVLEFQVAAIRDRTAFIRLDIQNGTLQDQTVEFAPPKITRPIIMGQGEGIERQIIQRSNADSVEAEADWGLIIEVVKDQRNTDVLAELEQAGDELLAADGFTKVAVKATPSNDQTMVYQEDFDLGDKVEVVIDDQPASSNITEAAIVCNASGLMTAVAVGDIRDFDSTSALRQTLADTQKRVGRLEREVEVDNNIETTIQATVVPMLTPLVMPAGTLMQYAGATAPAGYLLCQGQSLTRTSYPSLFSAIGTVYGNTSATTFTLPNMQGRVPVGIDAAQTEFDALGGKGGTKTHTLTTAEMPAHTHLSPTTGGGPIAAGVEVPSDRYATHDYISGAPTSSTGGGGAHNNLQPYIVLNYIIKT